MTKKKRPEFILQSGPHGLRLIGVIVLVLGIGGAGLVIGSDSRSGCDR